MTLCSIYARYSTDLQSEASIEDQVRLCREKAEREGWGIYEIYADAAVSGASLIRPGIQQLMADAGKLTFPRKSGHRVMRISPLPVQG